MQEKNFSSWLLATSSAGSPIRGSRAKPRLGRAARVARRDLRDESKAGFTPGTKVVCWVPFSAGKGSCGAARWEGDPVDEVGGERGPHSWPSVTSHVR